MRDVHHMMLVHFGTPPTKFDWRFHDKDKKEFKEFNDITPQQFYTEVVGYDLGNCYSIINDPRNDYMTKLTVEYLGNVVGGQRPGVSHINVESGVLRTLAMKMIDAGQPVWFGCDVGKEYSRDMAVMDTELKDYDLVYGCKPDMTKAERLQYGQSEMTHAMVLTAYDKKAGADKPQKWRVENSWGEDRGDKVGAEECRVPRGLACSPARPPFPLPPFCRRASGAFAAVVARFTYKRLTPLGAPALPAAPGLLHDDRPLV